MCISERLRQVCEAKNWKITDFAEQAGIAYRTMQGYIGGEREPNAEGMSGIAKAGVNLNWLVSGEGEMFQAVTPKNTISEQEEKLIADYRAMPENLKDAFAISFKEISEKRSLCHFSSHRNRTIKSCSYCTDFARWKFLVTKR